MSGESVSIEETLPRPGYKYPWVLVIQSNEPPPDDRPYAPFVWAVYSQSKSTRARWTALAMSVDDAREAAREAVKS